MSSRGYGMLWHNPAVGYVSFGKNRTTWHAESTKQMDYWITVGDKPTDISRNYAVATGFAPMMPEHGLGFWQCKLRYWNQQQVLEVAREYKRRNLPIDVIVIDYFHWPHMGDFRFDPEFFPDPKAMVEELKSMGIEVMVSVWPTVALGSENYREMRQQGLMLRADYGEQITHAFTEYTIFIDATNPRTRESVWENIKRTFMITASICTGWMWQNRKLVTEHSKITAIILVTASRQVIFIPSICRAFSMREWWQKDRRILLTWYAVPGQAVSATEHWYGAVMSTTDGRTLNVRSVPVSAWV